MDFLEFPKIARFARDIIITEKIDGTNGVIGIEDDGVTMHVGSRTRWLTPESGDNVGFLLWATVHRDELLTLGPGRHFGEWWGSDIQRGYGLQKGEKRFSLFNVQRWVLHGQTPQRLKVNDPRVEKYQEVLPPCVGLVPILYRGEFSPFAIPDTLHALAVAGSKAVPGFMQPEGIVIFHTAGNVVFKQTLMKDGEPKSREVR
jgi:hypothetical protein